MAKEGLLKVWVRSYVIYVYLCIIHGYGYGLWAMGYGLWGPMAYGLWPSAYCLWVGEAPWGPLGGSLYQEERLPYAVRYMVYGAFMHGPVSQEARMPGSYRRHLKRR